MGTGSNSESHDLRELQARYNQLAQETATLEQSIERRAGQISALQRVGLDIASGLTMNETLQRIANHAAELLEADGSAILLTQADGSLEVMAVHGLSDKLLGTTVQINQALAGQVAAEQKSKRVDKYTEWPDAFSPNQGTKIAAAIGVPMIYQDRAVGVIVVFNTAKTHRFNDDDQQALETLASPAAVATANAELYSRAHRLSQRLSVLLATELQLSAQATHLNEMMNTVSQTVISLFGCDGATIWLWRNSQLKRVDSRFSGNNPLPKNTYGWNEGLPGRALAQTTPLIEDDPAQPNVTRAALPMMWQGQPVGVLVATYSRKELRFSRDEIDLLSLFGQSVAASVINADLLASLRAERDRLETILSSTLDPVLVADQDTKLILNNPSAGSILHAAPGEPLLDLLDGQIVPPDSVESIRKSLESGVQFIFTMRVGRTIFSVRAAPLRHPERGWVLVLRDVTGLKELEELKTRMIHMMSHDLKNPLTGIIGLSQMLVKKSEGFTPRQKDYVANISSSALRMEDLINNILDLEKASSSGLSTQTIEGDLLFKRLMGEFQPEAKTRMQTLTLNMPETMPKIAVDEVQFYQALSNLVSNAIKYTPPEGKIEINVRVDGALLHVAVKDNGIGIPRDKQGRLFERFYRVRSTETSHIPGTGLGLSLIKAVIEAHGGAVWVESEEGKGSTFHAEAPVVVK